MVHIKYVLLNLIGFKSDLLKFVYAHTVHYESPALIWVDPEKNDLVERGSFESRSHQ